MATLLLLPSGLMAEEGFSFGGMSKSGPHPFVVIRTSNVWGIAWQVLQGTVTFSSNTMNIGGNVYMWQTTAPATGDLVLHLRNNSILYWGGDGTGSSGGDNLGSHIATNSVIARTGGLEMSSGTAYGNFNVSGGSITITGGVSGVHASSFTSRGVPFIASTWSAVGYEGFSLKVTSGSIAANTTITINASDLGWTIVGIPICGEIEGVNTAATSIRLKDTLSATAFSVFNSDALNAKKFTCYAVGRP